MTETANVPHPMQPLVKDSKGVVRFKANQIVQHLLDTHPICDLNKLACMNFSEEDRQQFAQLLGYSLDGYGDLSYVSDENYAAAFIARVKLDNEPVTDLKQGTKIKIKEGNPQAGCTGIIVGKASMYNPVNGASYVIQPDKPIESWPYSTFVLFECQFDVIDASLDQIKDSQSSASPAPPAEGEVAELTRSDVLHWLQQDRSWGVLIAPIEWRAVDEEWLDLIHRAVMSHRVSPNRDRYKPPAPPAEGEVAELVRWLRENAEDERQMSEATTRASLMLDRAAELLERAMPVPVSVVERMPGPEDCDPEGYCWRWNTIAGSWARQPISRSWYEFETHWLPAHALPLPCQSADSGQ